MPRTTPGRGGTDVHDDRSAGPVVYGEHRHVGRAVVGLADVIVLAVDDQPGQPIRVHVEQRVDRPRCGACGAAGWVKDRPVVELVDLPCFGRPARLVWPKHRWCCPAPTCPVGSWNGSEPGGRRLRMAMTDRAGRWATAQVGRHCRTVNEIGRELGCDWHTVDDRYRLRHPTGRRSGADRTRHGGRA